METKLGVALAKTQHEAVATALSAKVMVITGGPPGRPEKGRGHRRPWGAEPAALVEAAGVADGGEPAVLMILWSCPPPPDLFQCSGQVAGRQVALPRMEKQNHNPFMSCCACPQDLATVGHLPSCFFEPGFEGGRGLVDWGEGQQTPHLSEPLMR